MVRLTKSYTGSIELNSRKGNVKDELVHYISVRFSTWRKILCTRDLSSLSEGTPLYRDITYTVKTDLTTDAIKTLVNEIIRDYRLTGVLVTVTQQRNRVIINLKNTLIGDRVEFYTISFKNSTYKIKRLVRDLEANEVMEYSNNKFKSYEDAERVAKQIIELLR